MSKIAILDARRLPWPVHWDSLFGREAPLWMEIGFGNAKFLLTLAQTHLDVNVIGVEISQTSLHKAIQGVEWRQLDNVSLIYGTAEGVLLALCRPESLERVYINFPDPWPKAGHQHRRLIKEPFLELLATRMPPAAPLDIATDHPDYAEWIETQLANTPYFESRLDRPFVSQDPERLRTKYELKGLEEGRPPRYYKWQRNNVPTIRSFPVPQELSMPHVIMYSPLSLQDIPAHFEPSTWTEEGIAVRFVDLFQSPRRDLLLVDTHVEEEPFAQRIALTIRPRQSGTAGEIIVSLHEFGFPRPTPGVHRAVDCLTRYLLQLDPTMRVITSNVSAE